ncbi:DUF1566 domain-containing protein [bacterium]|nr:DUF1566 domain-containing protein [bacterium]
MKHKRIIFVSLLFLLISFMSLYIFAQGIGYIQIKCELGAIVFLDDNFVGNTSSELKGLILQDVPAGSHEIKIVKEGFEPQSVKIDLKVNEIYVYEVTEFIPQLDVIEKGEAETDSIKQIVGSLLIETIPIDCIIEIPKLNINKEHDGNKTKKTWEISNIPIGSYSINFIALGKKIEYELKIEEGVQKHLLVNILNNEVKEILPHCVTFSVGAGNGTIEARADGNLINSGDLVKEGVKIIFKATPDTGQMIKSWEVDGRKINTLKDNSYIIENLQSAIDFKVYFDIKPPQIGDKGPAGGWIFYDKGSYSGGWRYLEAAPKSTEWTDKQWGSFKTLIGGTETGIGTGQSNTTKIIDIQGTGHTYAAQLCDALVYGGYTDWFLPSKDELNLMYKNLKVNNNIGGFASDSFYWSSSVGNGYNAWYQLFAGGSQSYGDKYDYFVQVRAVRAF